MSLDFPKRSVRKILERNETQTSEVKRAEVCWSNYPIPIYQDWKLSPQRSGAGFDIHFNKPQRLQEQFTATS
jgi:hypothetical protein